MSTDPGHSARRLAIVTGGTSGIGQAITLVLVRRGFDVVAIGNDRDQALQTERLLAGERLSSCMLLGDVSNAQNVSGLIGEVLKRYGRIDVLCNNAAIRPVGTILETDEESWDRTFAINVKGAYLFSRGVLPTMIAQRSGVIINTTSPSGYGGRKHIAYAASKGAMFAFTKSLAIDHIQDGIRVNAIVPGFTLTGMTKNFAESRKAASVGMNVAGRMRLPEDIASTVAFLVSDEAATITGATWEIGAIEGQMVLGTD